MRGLVFVLLLAACSGSASAPREHAAAPAPAPAPTERASAEPAPTEAAAPTPPPTTPSPTPPAEVLFGEVFALEPDTSGGDVVLSRMLVVERPPVPRPDAEPIGYAMVHAGYWELRPVREEPSPYATVGIAGEDDACDARVVRARTLYASMEVPEYDAPGGLRETSYDALEIEGCEGAFGVAGRSVRTTPLRDDHAPPASAARIAQIAALDAPFAEDSYMPDGGARALEFPERQIAVVFGHRTWLVHRDVPVVERYGGSPSALVEAGDRVFVIVDSPSEAWMARLEDFHTPRPDGTAPFLCTVADPAGTPLNVRAEAGGRTAVVGTLPNGSRVDVVSRNGTWWRVDGDVDGWVYGPSLRCD